MQSVYINLSGRPTPCLHSTSHQSTPHSVAPKLNHFLPSFLAFHSPRLLQPVRATMKATRFGQSLARSTTTIRSYSTVHDLPHASSSFVHPPTAPTAAENTSVFQRAINATAPRNDWTKEQISEIHQTPLMELAFAAVCSSSALGRLALEINYTHHSTRAHYIEDFTNPPPFSYVPS